jgi:hypothetical protein
LDFNLYPMPFPFTESFVADIADAPIEYCSPPSSPSWSPLAEPISPVYAPTSPDHHDWYNTLYGRDSSLNTPEPPSTPTPPPVPHPTYGYRLDPSDFPHGSVISSMFTFERSTPSPLYCPEPATICSADSTVPEVGSESEWSESSLDDFEDQVDDLSDYLEEDMDDEEPDIPLILGADDATYEGTVTFAQMAHHYGIGPMELFHSEEARLYIFRY